MKERIYVCHTYYHVYVTFLKEFALPRQERGKATVLLSKMSTDFESLGERLKRSGVFEEVLEFDERRYTDFEELVALHRNRNSMLKNMWSRIRFTKRYAQLEEPYIPVDFRQYGQVYVFCDSDPIGYYLNYRHIPYHALEDGLNCLKLFDAARVDNRGCFWLKSLLASLNLIFIQNGYSRYCVDMEINDRDCLLYDCKKYKVVPRSGLEARLTQEEKNILVSAFLENAEGLRRQLAEGSDRPNVLLLTEKLCSEEVRARMMGDIIRTHAADARVLIKPHPMDTLDYGRLFPDCIVLQGRFPLEILKHVEGIHFAKVVAILTQAIDSIDYADEKIFLGPDFLDAYEEPEHHALNRVLQSADILQTPAGRL